MKHTATAPPRVRGFIWNTRPDACPALLELHHVTWSHRFKPENRVSLPHWALIGLLTPGFLVKAGSARARWLPHPAFTWRLYPPGCPFWEDDRKAPEPTRSMWIAFSGGERIGLEQLLSKSNGYGVFDDPEGILVTHVDSMVESAQRHREAGYWTLQMELLRTIVLLEGAQHLREGFHRLNQHASSDKHDARVLRAQQFIKAHVWDKITLGDIARHAGTSVPTLARCFKAVTGESPMQMWTRFRIDQARDGLLAGKSIKELADSLGFYDAFHLSKTFKQFEGCSPRVYLRRVRTLPASHGLHIQE